MVGRQRALLLSLALVVTLVPAGAPGAASGPFDEGTSTCDAGQSDAGSGTDASDDPEQPSPLVGIEQRPPEGHALEIPVHRGTIHPLVAAPALDGSDNYALEAPDGFNEASAFEPWELVVRVRALPATPIDATVYAVDGSDRQPLGRIQLGPLGGSGTVSVLVQQPYDGFVLSVNADPVVTLADVECPELALGPLGASAAANNPLDRTRATAGEFNYDFGAVGCKPQC